VKNAKEKLIEYTKEYRENFKKFSDACLKIQDVGGNLVAFQFNEVQSLLHRIIKDIKKQGRLVRLVILKARREGVSTYFSGRFYWKTSLNRNRYTMIIAHEPEATGFLFNMQKRFYAHIPPDFKPQERYDNKKVLEFNNDKGNGLDSAIRVGTAGKDQFGSAQLIHYLLLSELSKYPKANTSDLLTSLLQTVPDEPDTEVVMESTALSNSGEFYDRYWKARYHYEIYLDSNGKARFKQKIRENTSPKNIYTSIFIPYFVFQKYKMPVPKDFKLDDEEKELKERYNISDEGLMWRRYAIENKCNRDVEIFHREYPTNELECFLSTGISPFDVGKVMKLRDNAPEPIARYECLLGSMQFVTNKDGRFLVWEEPKSKRYLVSADPAEGLEGGDYSSVDVIDHLTGDQVAHWHGHISPGDLGRLLVAIGVRYNNAILCVERNNAGILTIEKILDSGYRNVYVETVIDPPAKPRRRFGWVTSKKTKYPLIETLADEIRNDTHGIRCVDTFNEMLSYKQIGDSNNIFGAEPGKHDDRVMSIAIAKYIRTRQPLNVNRPNNVYSFTAAPRAKHRPINATGWT